MPRKNREELARLEKDLSNIDKFFRNLPLQIGNIYLNVFLDSFKRGGFIDKKFIRWQPRKDGDSSRAILVKSGRLRRSLSLKVRGNVVEISTSVPYAQIHNEGGRVQTTQNVRAHTRKTKRGASAVRAHTRRVSFTMPKRQFMGKSDFANRRIILNLERQLDKIFK